MILCCWSSNCASLSYTLRIYVDYYCIYVDYYCIYVDYYCIYVDYYCIYEENCEKNIFM